MGSYGSPDLNLCSRSRTGLDSRRTCDRLHDKLDCRGSETAPILNRRQRFNHDSAVSHQPFPFKIKGFAGYLRCCFSCSLHSLCRIERKGLRNAFPYGYRNQGDHRNVHSNSYHCRLYVPRRIQCRLLDRFLPGYAHPCGYAYRSDCRRLGTQTFRYGCCCSADSGLLERFCQLERHCFRSRMGSRLLRYAAYHNQIYVAQVSERP